MINLGIIGYPLKHSYSKKIFNTKYLKTKIKYENYEFKKLNKIREFIFNNNISGLNITSPHKQEIIKYLDIIDGAAKKTKSINTLKIDLKKKQIKGFNTDVYGFEVSLNNFIKNQKIKAIIFGNGGVSKSVKYILEKINIEHIQISRNYKKHKSYNELNKDIFKKYKLLINCTTLGMYPKLNDKININYDFIDKNNFVFDMIYNPAKTEMLKKCEKKGAKIKNGLEMLNLQAAKSFDIWTNKKY